MVTWLVMTVLAPFPHDPLMVMLLERGDPTHAFGIHGMDESLGLHIQFSTSSGPLERAASRAGQDRLEGLRELRITTVDGEMAIPGVPAFGIGRIASELSHPLAIR